MDRVRSAPFTNVFPKGNLPMDHDIRSWAWGGAHILAIRSLSYVLFRIKLWN